jgi:nitrite reductase (NO-forming)
MAGSSLPIVAQAPPDAACCDACRNQPAGQPGRRSSGRAEDRTIALGGLAIAMVLGALALATLLIPGPARLGLWLPLHLGLAGAAGTAIAAVLPFFSAALWVVPPADPRIRIGAIALLALGAVAVSGGMTAGSTGLVLAGGWAYLGGLGLLAMATFAPTRAALGRRHVVTTIAYAVALVNVSISVSLALAMLSGVAPIVAGWPAIKPVHAWLNVFGFVGLVIAGTLLHLAPTVSGTRVRTRRSSRVAVAGIAAGVAGVAIGQAAYVPTLVQIGVVSAVAGAAALVAHGLAVYRDRGRWHSDQDWHRLTATSLTLAPVWLLVAISIAGLRAFAFAGSPAAWSLVEVAAPLALGCVAQVLVGSVTHLLPAIGRSDAAGRARSRRVLGRWATARIVALNLGTAVAVVGVLADVPAMVLGGGAGVLTSLTAGLALMAVASTPLRRQLVTVGAT